MYDTFIQGKDLYSEIASKSFNVSYEECLEHFPKGSYIKKVGDKWYYATESDYDKIADGETDTYKDGKERRSQAKSILLGRPIGFVLLASIHIMPSINYVNLITQGCA